MKQNNKFPESIQLFKKYEKNFEDSTFDPYSNYDKVFNDIYSNFSKAEKKLMRDYHNTISMATGIKCGLTENENEENALKYLNYGINMVINPIRNILLNELFKCNFEIINFGINILLYSMFYHIVIDENNDMNKSLSRKFLYYECNLLPYDLFLNKNVINRNTAKIKENDENEIKTYSNKDNVKIEVSGEQKEIPTIIVENFNNEKDKNLLLFKTEIYELKYKDKNDIYKKDFILDINIINSLINLLQSFHPYCSLELLLTIYNIQYLSCPIQNNKNEEETKKNKEKDNEKEKEKVNDIISKDLMFSKEHIVKLIEVFIDFIEKLKLYFLKNISFKYISFELLENTWNEYKNDYSFNVKNLIIKYILTPYYICIPSTLFNVEDFPFKSDNNKFTFKIFILGYLALKDLLKNKKSEIFPLENGNFEYKTGDKINFENINIDSSKFKILKILLKKNNKDEFEECILFVYKNSIIFGYEEKNEKKESKIIKIKGIHPLRELEICLDNSSNNSLQIYFKSNNYLIELESNAKRKEIKAELEQKRNEFRKWEHDNFYKLLEEEEKKYKELLGKYKINFDGKIKV